MIGKRQDQIVGIVGEQYSALSGGYFYTILPLWISIRE